MVDGYTGPPPLDLIPWYWPPPVDPPSGLVRDQLGHVVDTRYHPGLVGTDQRYGVRPQHVRTFKIEPSVRKSP
jgi:hypothetical protein